MQQNDADDSYEIELWNTNGLIGTYKADQPTFRIPIDGLQEGVYFVRLIKGGQAYSQKLMVK